MSGSALSLSQLAAQLSSFGAQCCGDDQVIVDTVSDDSRSVLRPALFAARSGLLQDGRSFIDQAVAGGAVAVLCGKESGVTFEPRIEVTDVAQALGYVAQELAGRPTERLRVVGVTGTNGKTTTVSLIDQALRKLGVRSARLGTLGFFIGEKKLGDTLTTPGSVELARICARAVEQGVDTLVMEVSSHALDQARVAGVRFDVTAFTNLSQDHLDYHGTVEAYGAAKAKLFLDYQARIAVICCDDAFGARLAAMVSQVLCVSAGGKADAGIFARRCHLDESGISAELVIQGSPFHLSSALVGLHNVENLLVALGVVTSLGFPPQLALEALSSARAVPGRLERCDADQDDIVALVDYAHTPDALRRVLCTIRDVTQHPIVCVFGCGGDRDRSKRPLMAEAVAAVADVVWLTTDNPRFEDPAQIAADARAGFGGREKGVFEEPDRRRAIEQAIIDASPGSVVLIAGKGHETYQLVGDQVLPFDDRIVAREALARRRAEARRAV